MKKFFRRYYVREITPLRFHKLYHYILTPINIVITVLAIITMLINLDDFDILSFFYEVALLICCVLTFIGCFHFKKYAWIAIMGGFALELIYDLCFILFLAPYGWDAVLYAVSEIIWRVIVIVLMGIYYIKRQPLFFHPVPYEELPEELR